MRFVTRKATEPETVIPLATVNFNRLVLVGDHKQVCGGDCDYICRLCVSACVQIVRILCQTYVPLVDCACMDEDMHVQIIACV